MIPRTSPHCGPRALRDRTRGLRCPYMERCGSALYLPDDALRHPTVRNARVTWPRSCNAVASPVGILPPAALAGPDGSRDGLTDVRTDVSPGPELLTTDHKVKS